MKLYDPNDPECQITDNADQQPPPGVVITDSLEQSPSPDDEKKV